MPLVFTPGKLMRASFEYVPRYDRCSHKCLRDKNNFLTHCQFQQHLQELESVYRDLFYFSKIRWLSRGKCIERFWNLRDKIKNFLKENCFDVPKLEENQSLLDLCFLAYTTKKLNKLDFKLQGEEKLITDYYKVIQAFVAKLKLYNTQLKSKNAVHFPLLHGFKYDNKETPKYADLLTQFLVAFQERYALLGQSCQVFAHLTLR